MPRRRGWLRNSLLAVLVFLMLLGVGGGAWAQDYSFQVVENISRVYVNRDGSIDVEYWLTFRCDPGAHPIDVVDVGMPRDTYDLASAQAWFSYARGGKEFRLTDIRPSEYVDPGIEVHLGEYTIQPGEQGTLHVRVNVPEMVFPDTSDENYASVEFSPTYYGSEYVHGSTYMEISFVFPPGVSPDETRWHDEEPSAFDKLNDRLVFVYIHEHVGGDETFKHGISFPRTYVDYVAKAPLNLNLSLDEDLCGVCWGGGLALMFLVIMGFSQIAKSKQKMDYMPPALAFEGVGIKRGLTAVEAALLLETPLDRVLTMILFGLMRKGAIIVHQEDPLKVEPVEPRPEGLRSYEEAFLDAVREDGTLDREALQEMFVALIREVNKKLKGFSRKETIAYYRDIVKRAWAQVEQAGTPQLDEELEWMLADRDFEDRSRQVFRERQVVMPPWWVYYRPWVPSVRQGRVSTSSKPVRGGRMVELPTLPGAAFAGNLVSVVERTASSVVGKLEEFTSAVTSKTNPPRVVSSSSSYRSGGCACACACAGCACACAGGGR